MSRGSRAKLAATLALSALLGAHGVAHAHEDTTAPRPKSMPPAPWPDGHAESHDVIVPVVLTVDAGGRVEDVVVEASVGEAFDRAAIATARTFLFEPARDAARARRSRVRSVVRFVAAAEPVAAPAPAAPAPDVIRGGDEAPPPVTVTGDAAPRTASSATLDRKVLGAAPHRTASDLLLSVPGFYVSQHSGEGKAHQIFFRGFDAVHGQDVEIWAGGAPVNDVSNLHGQGYADLHFLMPEIVKTVRALPGTYDPSQGDFAVAGSLRFELGYAEPGTTLEAQAGSFGTRRYFLAYHPKGETDATFAAAELYGTDGFGPNRAARRASAIAQVERRLGDGVTARVLATTYATRFDSAGVLRVSDLDGGVVGRFDTYDPEQGGSSTRSQLVLELRQDGDRDSFRVAPYLVLRSLGLRSNFTGFLTSPEGDSLAQRNDATTVGATASYRRRLSLFSAEDALETGVSLRHDVIQQSQHRLSLLGDRVTDDALSPGVDAGVRATDAAGYVDVSLKPLRRVTLRGGVRGDGLFYAADDRSDGRGGTVPARTRASEGALLSPRVTLDVGIVSGLHGVLGYGEGFRSPQARQLADGETTPFTRVRSVEVGARYAHRRALTLSAAVFRTALTDDLVFDQSTGRNERVPSTARTGAALTFSSRPVPWFLSATSFTYTHAAFTGTGQGYVAGDLLPYVPRLVVRSDLSFTPRLGELLGRSLEGRFGIGLTFSGAKPLPYGESARDAHLVDALAELRLREIGLGVDVYNVLDAEWFDGEFVYASRFRGAADLVPTRHASIGAPRTVLLSLSLYL